MVYMGLLTSGVAKLRNFMSQDTIISSDYSQTADDTNITQDTEVSQLAPVAAGTLVIRFYSRK